MTIEEETKEYLYNFTYNVELTVKEIITLIFSLKLRIDRTDDDEKRREWQMLQDKLVIIWMQKER